MKKLILCVIILSIPTSQIFAQTKRKPRPKPAAAKNLPMPTNSAGDVKTGETSAPINIPAKKNERADNPMPIPEASENTVVPSKKNSPGRAAADKANAAASRLPFNYEFSQPKFYISRVVIEHDAAGKGKITFQKQDLGDSLTDPLTISARALEKIAGLWTTLNLIESGEDYQSTERSYAHLGTMKLRCWQGDMVREVEFNWTENQTARELTDEYKKLTEQYLWIFDMNLARENQPLNAPQLADRLDSLINRHQISDPKQMIGFLREVADDERLPLIARNHTTKIIGRIEKLKEEK